MEFLETRPAYEVSDADYRRLLGWPRNHVPAARALELMAQARAWYAAHGRPWLYGRRVALQLADEAPVLAGRPFASTRLAAHLREHAATEGAALLFVSAGAECEAQTRALWEEGKPDEYFFLETYASAVVEALVAAASGRICAEAEAQGARAVPHYSPGYTGWDVAEQPKLFDLLVRDRSTAFPEPVEVLESGMLRPKKSLLAVVGLAPASSAPVTNRTPCQRCALTPCAYRRAPHLHAGTEPAAAASAATLYTLNPRALRKWADERVRLDAVGEGKIEAVFRFDGTTCANLGQPLAFDYRLLLAAERGAWRILECSCAPADEGYRQMCTYLTDGDDFVAAIDRDHPPVGRLFDETLAWNRVAVSAACLCTPENRVHKWRMALESIHFALAQRAPAQPAA